MGGADCARQSASRSPAYWLRVAAVSLAAALLITALFTALGRRGPVSTVLWPALVHAATLAGLAGVLVPALRHRLSAAGAGAQWMVTVAALLGVAAGGTALACGVIVATSLGASFRACFVDSLPIDGLLTMTIGVGLTLYEAQRDRLAAATLALRTQELERERERRLALRARLASLESRLQPHFLFNTLNAISALIQEDPDRAERMVERLAALLRFALDAGERGLVPLADELKIVTDYLEIEQARLGDRLAYALDVHPDAAGAEVPPLAVQTLVENSVKHAIAPRPAGGRIRVGAAVAGGRLRLTVWDDGPGFPPAALPAGHGLESLQARLAARFGEAASLTIARQDGGTLVTLSLPRPGT
jgi:signal transduction histidine kinase